MCADKNEFLTRRDERRSRERRVLFERWQKHVRESEPVDRIATTAWSSTRDPTPAVDDLENRETREEEREVWEPVDAQVEEVALTWMEWVATVWKRRA